MGVKGGYVLNKSPEEISFKDVIEAIDGPIYLNRCLLNPEDCNRYPINCEVHKELRKIQGRLLEDLDSVNFKDLAARGTI